METSFSCLYLTIAASASASSSTKLAFLFALDLVAAEDCSSLVLIVVAALVCLSSLYQLHALSVLARPSMHVVELHCVVSVQQFADFVHVIVVVTLLSLFSLHQVQFLSAVSPLSMPSVGLHFVFSFQQFLYLLLNLHFSVVLFVVSAALLTVHLLFPATCLGGCRVGVVVYVNKRNSYC